MAIPTFVAGNVLTAAQLNTISTALTITDAWTSYTPTLTQSGAVTKTVTIARYIKVGRQVTVAIRLDITGTGTASNEVIVGLPAFVPVNTNQVTGGVGFLYDSSTTNPGYFVVSCASSTTFKLLDLHITTDLIFLGNAASTFSAALASGDAIDCTFTYESTT